MFSIFSLVVDYIFFNISLLLGISSIIFSYLIYYSYFFYLALAKWLFEFGASIFYYPVGFVESSFYSCFSILLGGIGTSLGASSYFPSHLYVPVAGS